jgi:uncharacterized protein YdeI (YjbR/CyaY-like superfamily)
MKPEPPQAPPILHCAQQSDWLEEPHVTSPGVWLKLAKKASDARSLTYDEAVEAALCFGWIDVLALPCRFPESSFVV